MKSNKYFPYILETHLVDHCNLNCKGCSHFAPLVNGEVFTDIDIFKRDFTRLRSLFENIYEIRLMGGEPLLHPELLTFCDLIRKIFPETNVSIYTNGTLLLKMPDAFWQTCSKKNIRIKISYYPVDLKINEIKRKAKEMKVKIKTPKQIKSFFRHLNINGNSDPNLSFSNCRIMFKTTFLRDGKLYPCFFPPHAHIFSEYFNKNIYASENDYINILGNVDQADIIEFLNRPIPMCKWCLTRRAFTRWGISRRDINEWIGNDADMITHFFRKIKYRTINRIISHKNISKMKVEKQNEN